MAAISRRLTLCVSIVLRCVLTFYCRYVRSRKDLVLNLDSLPVFRSWCLGYIGVFNFSQNQADVDERSVRALWSFFVEDVEMIVS